MKTILVRIDGVLLGVFLSLLLLPFYADARTLTLEESFEATIMAQRVEEKTFFVDTSPSPSKKDLLATVTIEGLTSGDKKCSGNIEIKYLIDEGDPYVGTFTVTACGSHKLSTVGRVRYLYFRFLNTTDVPAKLRIGIRFTWEEK